MALHAQMMHNLSSSAVRPNHQVLAPPLTTTRGVAVAPTHLQQQQHCGARRVVCQLAQRAGSSVTTTESPKKQQQEEAGSASKAEQARRKANDMAGLGELGPIGLTIGADVKPAKAKQQQQGRDALVSGGGVELGPIGMTFGGDATASSRVTGEVDKSAPPAPSIHTMTTAEWRAKYEKDGMIDLWVEEEFNAGSRLVGGRAVHLGGVYGFRTGEGVTAGDVPMHKVRIHNHYQNTVLDLEVPEDRYILWEAEDKGLQLPYACRMGCCTACAVKIVEGEMYQPEALGISEELKQQGYALMCVGFPSSDLVIETVPEDEVYELQFGETFAAQALDPNGATIERDDFALSVANMDE